MTRNITKHLTWSRALDTANEPGGPRFADKHDHGSADVDARRCELVCSSLFGGPPAAFSSHIAQHVETEHSDREEAE
jgi:hypothetical protein